MAVRCLRPLEFDGVALRSLEAPRCSRRSHESFDDCDTVSYRTIFLLFVPSQDGILRFLRLLECFGHPVPASIVLEFPRPMDYDDFHHAARNFHDTPLSLSRKSARKELHQLWRLRDLHPDFFNVTWMVPTLMSQVEQRPLPRRWLLLEHSRPRTRYGSYELGLPVPYPCRRPNGRSKFTGASSRQDDADGILDRQMFSKWGREPFKAVHARAPAFQNITRLAGQCKSFANRSQKPISVQCDLL